MQWEQGQQFDLIMADPPWMYREYPKKRGSAINHYPTMSPDALRQLPVEGVAARDCVLLLWATGLKLPEAIELMKAWGFDYRGVFCTWVKTTKAGNPAMSCGFYTRSGSEFVLLGVRGKATELRRGGRKDVMQVLMAERTRHSAKPHDIYTMAERVFPGAHRKLELFARGVPKAGYVAWGNEVAEEEQREEQREEEGEEQREEEGEEEEEEQNAERVWVQ